MIRAFSNVSYPNSRQSLALIVHPKSATLTLWIAGGRVENFLFDRNLWIKKYFLANTLQAADTDRRRRKGADKKAAHILQAAEW